MWSIFFLILSYLDKDLVQGDADAETRVTFLALSDTVCAKSSIIGEYELHQVCDGVEEVRSVRGPAGQLVRCSVTDSDAQVASFMRACRLGLRTQERAHTGSEPRISDVAEAKENCARLESGDAHAQNPGALHGAGEAQKFRRSRRGFTYPGTLWCGAGNIAEDYEQLGEFTETDRCCRTHDQCPHVVHAFSSNYGYTNFKWHSISHCACDNALKQCLRLVNDTSSRVVGQAFFNVIEVPCFEFSYEEQCVERHWYGVCKRYDRVPVAVVKESIPYDFGGVEVIDVLTRAPPQKNLSDLHKDEQEKAQSSFSTSTSTPEEPSLTNVVTAAEDFIKVLATVSTSQSSSADGSKGESQTSDKKRKKNGGKKKKDSKKRRGKGKRRKQNIDRVSKAADRTEEVLNKNHFVEDLRHFDGVSKNDGNFMNGAFHSVGNGEHSNKMMRDEYQMVPDARATTAAPKQTEETLKSQKPIKDMGSAPVSYTTHIPPSKSRPRQRVGRKKHGHLTPTSLPLESKQHNKVGDNPAVSSTSPAGPTTHSPISPAGEEAPRSPEYRTEKGSAFIAATQNTPIVTTKRPRSRQRGGRKRSRKLSPPSSPAGKTLPLSLTTVQTLVPAPTLEPNADPVPQLQNLSDRLENPASSAMREVLPKRRHQRLKVTQERPVLPTSNPGDMTTTGATVKALIVTDSQHLLQIKNADVTTGQISSLIQTPAPSATKTAKRRRSKERGGEKRRRNKAPEA